MSHEKADRRGRPRTAAAPEGSFGARLAQLREQAGLSTEELAERAGVSVTTVIRLETGRARPTLETAQILARAMGYGLAIFDFDFDFGQEPNQ